jgi:transcriptional regulator with XRE-family HTH domain
MMAEHVSACSLGQAIRERRQELGWSQETLAARVVALGDAAFRQSDVSRLELGKVGLPHRIRLASLAAALDLPLGELLARSGWAGAEAAFTSETPRAADQGTTFAPARLRGDARMTAWLSNIDRLRSVIADAEATRERTRDILQRCEGTRGLYDRQIRARRRD